MPEISNPHDRFFREVFSRLELAREFLSKQLPTAIAVTIDWASLSLRPGSFLDEELQQYFSDLLFRANLQTGEPAYVYILLEHKSYPEWFTGLQLLRYQVEIWEQVRKETKANEAQPVKSKKTKTRTKLPPIFPLVIYQRKRPWHAPQQFHDLIEANAVWGPYLPAFRYELVSVVSLRETELFSAVLLRAAIRLMRHIFAPDLAHQLPAIWEEFRNLAWGPDERGFLLVMLSYVSSANAKVTPEELNHSLAITFPQEGEQVMTTIAQQWLEEGLQQGLQRGLQQGARDALLAGIRSGLEARFAIDPAPLLQEIGKIQETTQLQRLLNLLFKVPSLAEFQAAYQVILANIPHDDNTLTINN
ncbi:MAG: Rpn family recombination-promoting nuclease/putative transposase [Caldilineaceae bacterium]|nr:Rpn family recombination-promoting nuclease/putative transposase [Caldilineaceae bacterium]